MRFIKVLIKVIIGLIIVAAIAGYLFIRNFDLNKYKSEISTLAEEQLGRKLAINGEAKLGISFTPTLIIEDVELANAEGASQPQMVTVGSLEVKLALLPLLKRQVVIDNVILQNPVINLEVAADGTPNWVFKKSGGQVSPQQIELMKDQAIATGLVDMKTADKAAEIVQKNPAAAALAGFAAKKVLIENGQFNMVNYQNGSAFNVELVRFTMTAPSMDAAIQTEFEVLFNGQNIKGKATLGALNILLAGTDAYPVEADLSAYGVSLNAAVNLHDVLTKPSFAANVNLHNPQGNFGAPDVKLLAEVSGNQQAVSANIQSLNVNGNIISGEVSVNISEVTPYVVANLNSDLINVASLAPVQTTVWQMPALIASAEASQFVPDTVIPFSLMKQLNAKAALNIKTLQVSPDMVLNNVSMNAVLLNGILNVNSLKADLGGGTLNAVITANSSLKNITVTAVSKGVVLQQLYSKLQSGPNSNAFGIVEGGNTDININLSGSGDTYRQLVDSMNGSAVVIVDKSVVHPGSLDILTGNFIMQILHTLKLDTAKVQNLDLTCAVVRADVTNGIVNFPKGIAVNSKQLNLVSSGKYNLNNDGIDFTVRPYSGQIIDANLAQALSSFIKIKGTAQDPKIVLDDAQALKALVGIAATGGTAYLGSQLVLDADSTPCYTALKGTQYQSRFPRPGVVTKTGQDIYQGTDDAVKGSVDAVKSTVKDSSKEVKKSLKDLESAAKGFLKSLQQ